MASGEETNKLSNEVRIVAFSSLSIGIEITTFELSGSYSLQARHQRFVMQFLK